MDMQLFTLLFTGLGIIFLSIGWYVSKTVATPSDYFLAQRSLGIPSIALTLIATQVGGGLILGTAEESYRSGYIINAGTLYPIGMGLGFLLLGIWFASRLRSFDVATIPELFEVKFNSKYLRKSASLISMLSLGGIVCALVISSRTLLSALGFTSDVLLIAFWLLVIAYTMLGGLKAVVVTDVYQVSFMTLILGSIFFYALMSDYSLITNVAGFIDPSLFTRSRNVSRANFLLMPVLFSLIEQDLAQRFFAARNKRVAAIAAVCAALGVILFALIPIFFGIKAKMMGLAVPEGVSPLIVILAYLTNESVLAFVVCAIMAAIISTGDSVLCAITSLAAQDFESGLTGKKQVLFSQILTGIIGIIALWIAYYAHGILSFMIQSYELPVSTLFVPIMASFCGDRYCKKEAAWLALCVGLLSFIVFRFVSIPFPRELVTLVLSGIGYGAGFVLCKE